MPYFRFSARTLELLQLLLESPAASTRQETFEFAEQVWTELDRWQKSHFGSMNGERGHLRSLNDTLPIFRLEANPKRRAAEGAILVADGLILALMPIPRKKNAAETAYAALRDVVWSHDCKLSVALGEYGKIRRVADRLRRKRIVATENEIRTLAEFVAKYAEPVFSPIDEQVDERIAAKGFRLGRVGDNKKYRALAGPVPAGALMYGPFSELMILLPPGDTGFAAASSYLDVYLRNPTRIGKSREKVTNDPKVRAALIALETSLEYDEYPNVEIAVPPPSWIMRRSGLEA